MSHTLNPDGTPRRSDARLANASRRRIRIRALVIALDGPEKPYPVYRFSRGRTKFERPGHNPFAE